MFCSLSGRHSETIIRFMCFITDAVIIHMLAFISQLHLSKKKSKYKFLYSAVSSPQQDRSKRLTLHHLADNAFET